MESIYDDTENPRSLRAVVSPEDLQKAEQVVENLEEQMTVLNRIVGTFNSEGWKAVQTMLIDEMVRAKRWCAERGHTATMEDLRYVQGQIRAYEYLMNLGDEAVKLKDIKKQDLRRLKTELELTGT